MDKSLPNFSHSKLCHLWCLKLRIAKFLHCSLIKENHLQHETYKYICIHLWSYNLLDVYTEYGKKEIEEMHAYNKKAELTGEVTIKVIHAFIQDCYSSPL